MTGKITFRTDGESHDMKISSWQRSNVSPSTKLTVEETRQMTEHNPLKTAREALEAAPIIGLWEDAEAFKVRQDNWLETKYREALAALETNDD
jgi:hypothetical protein